LDYLYIKQWFVGAIPWPLNINTFPFNDPSPTTTEKQLIHRSINYRIFWSPKLIKAEALNSKSIKKISDYNGFWGGPKNGAFDEIL